MSDFPKFEEYKLLLEDTTRLIERRKTESNLYTTINMILLAAITFLINDSGLENWMVMMGTLVVVFGGILISRSWMVMIENYKKLSNLRFQVLWEMEEDMPGSVKVFHREEALYPRDEEGKQVSTKGLFADVEKRLPIVFIILYAISGAVIVFGYLAG
jgi:hypothetical protein